MQKNLKIRKIALLAALSLLVISGCGKKQGKAEKADQKKSEVAVDSASVAGQKIPYALK